ncbi:MAG: DUF5057 domain-containing protein [Eubacterium sp.]|nr:DUF5057 domain-containing protein [Eubacterium sp.]
MKNRNARTLIISLGMMLIMCVATAMLSFSLADETIKTTGELVADAQAEPALKTTKTNIDYIIENSNDPDADISTFRIVEIGSSSNGAYSALAKMVENDLATVKSTELDDGSISKTIDWTDGDEDNISHFVNMVINGWSTVETEEGSGEMKKMHPDRIVYDYRYANTSDEDKIQEMKSLIGKADLIYVSNNPDNQYSVTNDIPEDVKILLSSAATATYTPFMIDSPTKTKHGGSSTIPSGITFAHLGAQVLGVAGSSRNAFLLDTSKTTDIVKYLSRTDSVTYKNGLWKPVSGSLVSGNWYTSTEYKREVTGKDANGYPAYKEEDGKPVYVTTDKKSATTVILQNADGKYIFKDADGNEVAIDAVNEDDTAQAQEGIDDVSVLKPVYVETEKKTTAKILTIQASAGDNAITNMFKTAVKTPAAYPYDLSALKQVEGFSTISANPEAYVINANEGNLRTYSLNNAFYKAGYAVQKEHPNNVIFDTVLASDVLDSSGNIKADISTYDIIILEAGLKNTKISEDTFRAFNSMVYGMQHIVYANTLTSTSGSGTNNDPDIETSDAVNYSYVMAKVADINENSRFSNVLVTGKAEMEVYGAAISPNGVKPIADIINNGSYRGVGGGGSSSNLYTVLEVQPCYPIDLNLAKALKQIGFSNNHVSNITDDASLFYYIETSSVINGMTSDEISFNGEVSLTDMESTDSTTTGISVRGDVDVNTGNLTKENAVDYYDWELSKAKIAYLTGLPYNKVNVVHMSSTEFDTSRETLLDNYDVIYIGGNHSGIRDIGKLLGTTSTNPSESDRFIKGRTASTATMYEMYFHNGGTYDQTSASGGIGVLAGNDITYNKRLELEEYVEAGMPLIFSSDVTDAFYIAKSTKYNNTLIDPDSNVYKLLNKYITGDAYTTDAAGNRTYETSRSNVLAGFDPHDQIKVYNADGAYGNTYGGVVTVFGGRDTEVYVWDKTSKTNKTVTLNSPSMTAVNAEELYNLLFDPSVGQRPKFSLIQTPMLYVEGDDSTELAKGSTITYKYDIASKENYDINIYIDDNANSRFEESELLYSSDPANKSLVKGNVVAKTDDSVSLKLPDSFDGAFYWKFELVAGKCKSSTTGLSKVTVDPDNKNYVNVLQIVDENVAIPPTETSSYTSLLFCTECQEGKGLLRGNRYFATGKYSQAAAIGEPFGDPNHTPDGGNPATLVDPSVNDDGFVNPAKGKQLGIHQHNFGIVKYDSQYSIGNKTGVDNWETNWAEDLYDEYDMDIDIWTTREYEAAVRDAITMVTPDNYAEAVADYGALATLYESYYNTMQRVIEGKTEDLETTDAYKQLKNKITGSSNTVLSRETSRGDFGISEAEWNQYRVAQRNLDNLLLSAKGKVATDSTSLDKMTQEITYETTYHRYSDFYSLSNNHNINYTANYDKYSVSAEDKLVSAKATGVNNNLYNEFSKYFAYWRNAKIFEQYFYKMYLKYLTYATMADPNPDDDVEEYLPDFTQVYSCIVIGASDQFGRDDIDNSDRALDAINAYIEKGGNTFIFHNTIYDGGEAGTDGTAQMTAALKDVFGQNYSHIKANYENVNMESFPYEIKINDNTINIPGVNTNVDGKAVGTILPGQGLDVNLVYDENWKLTDISSTVNNKKQWKVTRSSVVPLSYSAYFGKQWGRNANQLATNGEGTVTDGRGFTLNVKISVFYGNSPDNQGWYRWQYRIDSYSLTPNTDANDSNIYFKWDISGEYTNINENLAFIIYPTGVTLFDDNNAYFQWINIAGGSGSKTVPMSDLTSKVSVSGSPNNTVQLYVDGKRPVNQIETYELQNSTTVTRTLDIQSTEEVKVTYTTDGDPERYYISPLLKNGNSINISPDRLTWFNTGALGHTGYLAANMYKQAPFHYTDFAVSDPRRKQYDSRDGIFIYTNRASQTNKGVVTLYPFLISSELKISGTHPNSFSSDIEDDDLVVYYTLAGGVNAEGTHANPAAANPHDGIDQYFLYSYGSVTYCGAGHSNITGPGRDNNDERRLFINVILKSSRKSIFVKDVRIDVFDPTTSEENPLESNLQIIPVEDYYEMQINGVTDKPEFTFKVSVPAENTDVDEVRIYYDLTPDVEGEQADKDKFKNDFGFNSDREIDGKHYSDQMIFSGKSEDDANLKKGHYKQILSTDSKVSLDLQPSYFEPYGNTFTVVTIAVKTTDGKYYYQKIVVKLAPKLWDLT